MLNGFADFSVLVRNIIVANATPELRYCFSVVNSEDASSNQSGSLFRQNEDFVLFETEIDRVSRAGPGVESPRRAWAEITIGIFTKDVSDPIGKLRLLEEIGGWFADKTVGGVRFRQFQPLGESTLMGFRTHDAVINCAFELKPTR